MAAPWLLVSALVVLVVSSLLLTFMKRRRAASGDNAGDLFPRGPPSWPILGHLPLLLSGLPHQTLADLSRKHAYGPIICLHLGSTPTVIVSSAALAKEILFTHDKAFANRPNYHFVNNLMYGYGNAVIFSSYCPRWIQLRKMYTLELLTAKRLHDLRHVRLDSLRSLLQRLHEASATGTQAVPLGDFFAEMAEHTMSRLLLSKTLSEAGGESLAKLLREMEGMATPILSDFIPWLKCFDIFRLCSMQKKHARLDNILDDILLERRKALKESQPHELPHDFLQVLLSKEATSSQHEEELMTPEQIKGSLLDILVGGIRTTAITLEWAMAELIKNPRCLCKLQAEVDAVMGIKGEELITEDHVIELPYLENIVKEVFRLHPTVPLLVPRISSIKAKVDKYMLPTQTQMIVNVWAIGRDPKVWENAEQFLPERFEGKLIDLKGNHFDLLPFGSGRRICPGLRLGLSVLLTTLANLVKNFDWQLPHGQSPNCIDMCEKRGFTNCKAIPLLAIPKIR